MTVLTKAVSAAAISTLMATGALLATAAPASAYVVCNRDGDCWHSESRPRTVPGIQFSIHPDDWYFHQTWSGNDRHYRDYHQGRGYYRGGIWVTL